MLIYNTLFNGDMPFKVEICDNMVHVFSNESDTLVMTRAARTIFVGESPKTQMTIFSKGYGPEFTGNSILLELEDNKYEFIGKDIFSFTALSRISHFVSPVGNSLVPYPYAIDVDGTIYLMLEGVVLKKVHLLDPDDDDPYSYYYKNNLMGDFYIDENLYTLRYCAFPEKDYDRMILDLGKHLYIMDASNNKTLLTKEAYVDLMNEFGRKMSFEKIWKSSTFIEYFAESIPETALKAWPSE